MKKISKILLSAFSSSITTCWLGVDVPTSWLTTPLKIAGMLSPVLAETSKKSDFIFSANLVPSAKVTSLPNYDRPYSYLLSYKSDLHPTKTNKTSPSLWFLTCWTQSCTELNEPRPTLSTQSLFLTCYIIHNDRHLTVSYIPWNQTFKSFLSSSIPQVESHIFSINDKSFRNEIDTNSRLEGVKRGG